jgi:predicted ribosomally synthesized peptide with SipW-like signal peptide
MGTKTAGHIDAHHYKRMQSRRLRAVLAGGLALGLSAATTLVTWNDTEFAQGTFTAGTTGTVLVPAATALSLVPGVTATLTLASWNDAERISSSFVASTFITESSVQGAEYRDNSSTPGGTVTFSPAGIAPGLSEYFSVLIRTTAGSVSGVTSLNGATVSGADAATLGVALRYRVVRSTGACTAAAFAGTPLFVVGTSSSARGLTTTVPASILSVAGTSLVSIYANFDTWQSPVSTQTRLLTTISALGLIVSWTCG